MSDQLLRDLCGVLPADRERVDGAWVLVQSSLAVDVDDQCTNEISNVKVKYVG